MNQKSPEVLKSIARTSNRLSGGPPGPRAQAPGGSGDENGMCAGLGMVFEFSVLKKGIFFDIVVLDRVPDNKGSKPRLKTRARPTTTLCKMSVRRSKHCLEFSVT